MVLPSGAIMKDIATSPKPPASPLTPATLGRRAPFRTAGRSPVFRLFVGILVFACLLLCFNTTVLRIGRGDPHGYLDEGSPFPEGAIHAVITVRDTAAATAAEAKNSRTSPRGHPELYRLLDRADADVVAPAVVDGDGNVDDDNPPPTPNVPSLRHRGDQQQQQQQQQQPQKHADDAQRQPRSPFYPTTTTTTGRALQGRIKQYTFDGDAPAKPNPLLAATIAEPAMHSDALPTSPPPLRDPLSKLEAFLRVAPVPRAQLDVLTRLRGVCTITVVVPAPDGYRADPVEQRFPRPPRRWNYARFGASIADDAVDGNAALNASTTATPTRAQRGGWLEHMRRVKRGGSSEPTYNDEDVAPQGPAVDVDLVARQGPLQDRLMVFETLRVREYEAYLNGELYPYFHRVTSIRPTSTSAPGHVRVCARRHIYVLTTNESTTTSSLGRLANIGALTALVDGHLGKLKPTSNVSTLWFLDAAVVPRAPVLSFLRGLHTAVHGAPARPLGRIASCTVATGETVLSFGLEPVLDAHGDLAMNHHMSGFNARDERVAAPTRVAAASPLCFAMSVNAWTKALQGLRSGVGVAKMAESLLHAGSLFKTAAFHAEQALMALDPVMRGLPFKRPQARMFDSLRVALTKAIDDITQWEIFMNKARSPALGCPVGVRTALKGTLLTVLPSTPGGEVMVSYNTEDVNDFATPPNLATSARNTAELLSATFGPHGARDADFDVNTQKDFHAAIIKEWARLDMATKRLAEFVSLRERDERAMFTALLHLDDKDGAAAGGGGGHRRQLQNAVGGGGAGRNINQGPARADLVKMLRRDIQRAADREAYAQARHALAGDAFQQQQATAKPQSPREVRRLPPTQPPDDVIAAELARHKAAMKRQPPQEDFGGDSPNLANSSANETATLDPAEARKAALLSKVLESFRTQRIDHAAANAVIQRRRQELLRKVLLEARRFLRTLQHRRDVARKAHERLVALCNAGDESLWDAGLRVGSLRHDASSARDPLFVPTVAATAQVEPARLANFLSSFVVSKQIYDNAVMTPHLSVLQERATQRWLSSSVRVTWAGPCCGCCGFSNEMALILTPLARYVPTRTTMPITCHCKGMPGSVEALLKIITVDRDDPALRRLMPLWSNRTVGPSSPSPADVTDVATTFEKPVPTTPRATESATPTESPANEDGLIASMVWRDDLDHTTAPAAIVIPSAKQQTEQASQLVPAAEAISKDARAKLLTALVDDPLSDGSWASVAESPVSLLPGHSVSFAAADDVRHRNGADSSFVTLDATSRAAPIVPTFSSVTGAGFTTTAGAPNAATTNAAVGPPVEVWVYHVDPIQAIQLHWAEATADYKISRSMFEFSRINPDWVSILSTDEVYDEVWVPSRFVRESFIASGVPAEKTFVIPEPIDVSYFDPNAANKIDLPTGIGRHGWRYASSLGAMSVAELQRFRPHFKFLSIFKWEPRKGWDVLFKAYFDAFTKGDPVSLYVLTYHWWPAPPDKADPRDPNLILLEILQLASEAGKDLSKLPHFEIITEDVAETDVLGLYATCDAFVLPSRGEGWGLPPIQAMAMARPTITTRFSGMLDFTTDDTAMLIDVERIEPVELQTKSYGPAPGANWAEPSLSHLSALMKKVIRMPPEERHALGRRARDHIRKHFDSGVVATLIARRLMEVERIVRARVGNGTHAKLMQVRQAHDAAGRPVGGLR